MIKYSYKISKIAELCHLESFTSAPYLQMHFNMFIQKIANQIEKYLKE